MEAERIAAQVLDYRLRQKQLPATSELWGIPNVAEANRIQDRVAALMGEPVVGWKVGAVLPEKRAKRGLSEPFLGRVFASRLLPSPARLPIAPSFIEAEIAARLGADIVAGRSYSEAQIKAAIASWHPAYEVVDFAWPDWKKLDICEIIADNGGCGYLVVGAPVTTWEHIELRKEPVRLSIDGKLKVETIIDTEWPLQLSYITWLANHLSGRGIGLPRGSYVATGTLAGIITVAPGQTAECDFGAFGRISASVPAA